MPFQSKAQQRFAFATGQPWAHEWAAATKKTKKGFAGLPQHVRPVRKDTRTFSQQRREKLAAKGKTAYGTSFPMPDADAVRRARMSLGRAKNKAKARRAIAERMQQLRIPTKGTAFAGVSKSEEAPMEGVSAFGVIHDYDPELLGKRRGGCPNGRCVLPRGHDGACKESMGKAGPGTLLSDVVRGAKAGLGGWTNEAASGAEKVGQKIGAAATNPPESLQTAAGKLTSPKVLGTAAGVGAVGAGAKKLFQAARAGKQAGTVAGTAGGSLQRLGNWAAANPGKAALAGAGAAGGAYTLGRRNNS